MRVQPADLSRENVGKPQALIPVSRSTWYAGVRAGRYPQPVKLGERCTAWRVEEIRALIEATGKEVAR
ncbi:transcriptional regulator [Xanthomonas populi]|uniref:Transcriptional regulator n=1 Tax=Xanthomonas populi TaxID=53414 RepID=A0A2S7EAK2_9XANT|nr:transcriptional regulator [Xanthomonas populi]